MNFQLLSLIKEQLKPRLVRSHITNVLLINTTTIVLTSSYLKDEKVLISLEPLNPYINLVKIKDAPLTINNGLSQMLRHYMKESYIVDLSVENEDSILKMILRMKIEEQKYEDYFVYIELIKKKAKLIITNSDNKILLSTHYSKKDGERKILINEIYQYPNRDVVFTKEFDIEKYHKDGDKIYNAALRKREKEKFAPLFAHINHRLKTLEKKQIILNEEIKMGDELKLLKDYGDCCLYMEKEELYELLESQGIKYDYELSLIELSSYFFKKYKKGKAKVIAAKEQLEKCNEEIQYFNYLKDIIPSYTEEEMDSLSFTLLGTKKDNRKNEKIKSAKDPYKINALNTTFLFGRNSEQNHNLTFHKANNEDIFVHIHDYPGSHIIIKNPNPTNEQVIFAANMALALSKKTSGEVDYTKIKDVKSTTTTGLVILKKCQRIKLNTIDTNIDKILKEAKK